MVVLTYSVKCNFVPNCALAGDLSILKNDEVSIGRRLTQINADQQGQFFCFHRRLFALIGGPISFSPAC
jgi:hypothetical protein